MRVISKRKRDTLIITMEGELDHHSSQQVRERLDKLLKDPSIKNMVIDLKNLNFMDSSGIGVFIGRYKTIASRGGRVAVVNVSPQIDKIMSISGLYKIIGCYSNVHEALEDMEGV